MVNIRVGDVSGAINNIQLQWSSVIDTTEQYFILANSTSDTSAFYQNDGGGLYSDVIFIPQLRAPFTYALDTTRTFNTIPIAWLQREIGEMSVSFAINAISTNEFAKRYFQVPWLIDILRHRIPLCSVNTLQGAFACPLDMNWDKQVVTTYIVPGLQHVIVSQSLTGVLDRQNRVCYTLATHLPAGDLIVCSTDKVYNRLLPRYLVLTIEEAVVDLGLTLNDNKTVYLGTTVDGYSLAAYIYKEPFGQAYMVLGKAWDNTLNYTVKAKIYIAISSLLFFSWLFLSIYVDQIYLASLYSATRCNTIVASVVTSAVSMGFFTWVILDETYNMDLDERIYRVSGLDDLDGIRGYLHATTGIVFSLVTVFLWCTFVWPTRPLYPFRKTVYETIALYTAGSLFTGVTGLTWETTGMFFISIIWIFSRVQDLVKAYGRWTEMTFMTCVSAWFTYLIIVVYIYPFIAYIQDFDAIELYTGCTIVIIVVYVSWLAGMYDQRHDKLL